MNPIAYPDYKIEGKTFGIYKVLGDSGKRSKSGQKYWNTICSKCSKVKEVTTFNLNKGVGVDYCECMLSKTKKKKKTISADRIRNPFIKTEFTLNKDNKIHLEYYKPKTRGECCDGPRPCPYVSCKYNLYLDVNESGSIVINNSGVEPDEVNSDSCALDVADMGGVTAEYVGELMNISQQRVVQIEKKALGKLKEHIVKTETKELFLEGKQVFRGTQDGYLTKKEDEEIREWTEKSMV